MSFFYKKKINKILFVGIFIFTLGFINLFNVFSFESLINKVIASDPSIAVDTGGVLPRVISLPDPPILSCPDVLENSFWVKLFGESKLGGDSITAENRGWFLVCFLFLATQIFSFLIWVAIVLSVIFITYYGILYIVKPERSSDTNKKIVWAVVGLVVALLSYTVVFLIRFSFFSFNPNLDNIANLSFYWLTSYFQFINIVNVYSKNSITQNNIVFSYLKEKLILDLSML